MHALRVLMIGCLVVLAMPAMASAQSEQGERIVLAPVSSLSGESSRELTAVERVVEAGLFALPGFTLVTAKEANHAARRAKRPELRSCDGEVQCLSELGKLVSASYAVYAEVGGLGTAQVVYLKLVDARSGKELRSTTLELADGPGREADSLGAATRLVTPTHFVGLLEVKTSLPGALVYLDGHKIATTPSPPVSIYVGAHALRVTHPERSDYVRWVDVHFQKTTLIEADLAALPGVQQRLSLEGTIKNPEDTGLLQYRPTPWYYRWYTIGGGAAVVFVGSAILVGSLTDDINADLSKRL